MSSNVNQVYKMGDHYFYTMQPGDGTRYNFRITFFPTNYPQIYTYPTDGGFGYTEPRSLGNIVPGIDKNYIELIIVMGTSQGVGWFRHEKLDAFSADPLRDSSFITDALMAMPVVHVPTLITVLLAASALVRNPMNLIGAVEKAQKAQAILAAYFGGRDDKKREGK